MGAVGALAPTVFDNAGTICHQWFLTTFLTFPSILNDTENVANLVILSTGAALGRVPWVPVNPWISRT